MPRVYPSLKERTLSRGSWQFFARTVRAQARQGFFLVVRSLFGVC
jgi:hypothetical protein